MEYPVNMIIIDCLKYFYFCHAVYHVFYLFHCCLYNNTIYFCFKDSPWKFQLIQILRLLLVTPVLYVTIQPICLVISIAMFELTLVKSHICVMFVPNVFLMSLVSEDIVNFILDRTSKVLL